MKYHESTELCHHGILGQKWGIRRFQNKDGTRTAAGKARRNETQKKENIGLLLKKHGDRGINDLENESDSIDKISRIRKITKVDKDYLDMDDSEKRGLISSINSESGKYNCQACTAAFDMYMKTGYVFPIRGDVDTARWGREEFMNKLYKNFSGFTKAEPADSCTNLSKEIIDKYGNQAVYGRICLNNLDGSGSHAISFYTKNGKVRFVESQNGRDLSPKRFDESPLGQQFDWSSVEYTRTDDLEFSESGIEFLGRLTQRQ